MCYIIGVNLNKSHTSGTALRMHVYVYVCLLAVVIYREILISGFKYPQSLNILDPLYSVSEGLLPEHSIGMKEAWSEDDSS